jgi:uncharacterized protein YndB with AHSA1/START domain
VIKKILAGVGLLLAVFVVISALKPEEYLIKREIVINAKPEAIYPYLNNTKNADRWMPWKEIDPQVKSTYSGPEEGVGSISSWDSPGQMGTGKAEVTEAIPNQSVKTKITYTKPMEMSQDSEFILTPNGDSTKMTWIVIGKQPFIARLMCTLMFMNMDKYVGGMFERGLAQLKTMAETQK